MTTSTESVVYTPVEKMAEFLQGIGAPTVYVRSIDIDLNGKKEVNGAEKWKNATADMPVRRGWSQVAKAVGFRTGEPSGLMATDLDGDCPRLTALYTEHGKPETWTVQTRSGGEHQIFTWEPRMARFAENDVGLADNIVDGVSLGHVDLRADGRVVFTAPSTCSDGTSYKTTNPAAPIQMPDWLYEALCLWQDEKAASRSKATRAVQHAVDVEINEQDGRLRRALGEIMAATYGTKHTTLNSSAYTIGGLVGAGVLTEERAVELITAACHAAVGDVWPFDRGQDKTMREGIRDGMNNPLENNPSVEETASAWFESVPVVHGAVIGPDPDPVAPVPTDPTPGLPSRERLGAARATYRKWMGEHYDMAAADLAMVARAAHDLDGENIWFLILSGPGNAKTESIMPIGDTQGDFTKVAVVSDISGPAALLSGSPKKDTAKDATGGLLVDLGISGVVVLKDFTTILSMHREKRAEVLAALREVYDGTYVRLLGTDGGQAIRWDGSITLIGATTSAYDSAHSVISAMGDRFAVLRIDSESRQARRAATRQARRNTGAEKQMRTEMAEAVRSVAWGVDKSAAEFDMDTLDELDDIADVVTKIRTHVEFDRSDRDAVAAHAPEVGTRFGKMLVQIVRGGLAIGMERDEAMALARRVARDSATPVRVECLALLAKEGAPLTSYAVAQELEKPRATVDRALQALQLLGFVKHREADPVFDAARAGSWVWSLAPEYADAAEILGVTA